MKFNESVKNVFGNYANFKGRATRSEFWWFYLFYLLIYWALYIIGLIVGTTLGMGGEEEAGLLVSMNLGLTVATVLSLIFSLIVLVPWLAVSVRRFHDVGTSGWYLLISIIPLVGLVYMLYKTLSPTQPKTNRFGPVPQDYIV